MRNETKIKDTELQLETYRKRYTTNKNKALGKEIRDIEYQLEKLHKYTQTLEKEIRNTENIAINEQ